MKIDRHSPRGLAPRVKLQPLAPFPRTCAAATSTAPVVPWRLRWIRFVLASLAFGIAWTARHPDAAAVEPPGNGARVVNSPAPQASSLSSLDRSEPNAAGQRSKAQNTSDRSDPRAIGLLQQVLARMVLGPAFHAKVRETVWTHGREVVGVGTYEQAGGGSGRFHLQVTMHDGDGKHRLQQISDGRLAWTRTEIAGKVSLRRVDVGRLDEWVGRAIGETPIAPRLTVGAWAELLSSIQRDHILAVVGAKLEGEPVWVITGRLRPDRRSEVLGESDRSEWPMLFPTRVHVAIRSQSDPDTGFGELLPVRFEFWSDPFDEGVSETESSPATAARDPAGRLITLIELYSIQPISPPPAERFRFENQDAEVNFINETDRYIQLHGVHLTERELRQLRR
jgi:hypothetical protein